MQQIGTYLVLNEEGIPEYWCYFRIESEARVFYCTKPYDKSGANWHETILLDDHTFYLYDHLKKNPICYRKEDNNFYRIPMNKLGRQSYLSMVFVFKNGDFEYTKKKPRELKIEEKKYIWLKEGIVILSPPLIVEDETVKIDAAHRSLLVKKISKIDYEEEADLEDGTLFVWIVNSKWHFKTSVLGEETKGVLDDKLDSAIIARFQDRAEVLELSQLEAQQFSRCYLQLTSWQQAQILAIVEHVWPLSSNITTNEQVAVCWAVLRGEALTSKEISDEEKLLACNVDIGVFRSYLFPSRINKMFQIDYSDSVDELPIISDVILFLNQLIVAAARALGDESVSIVHYPPKIAKVKCGALLDETQIVGKGLSDKQTNLLNLIVEVELHKDEVDALSFNELMSLNQNLEGVLNPAEAPPEISEVADYALAVISEVSGSDQLVAREELIENCKELQDVIFRKILKELFSLKLNNFISMCADICSNKDTCESLANLLQVFNKVQLFTGENAETNFYVLAKNEDIVDIVRVLELLNKLGLLTNRNAKENFAVVIDHQYPALIACLLNSFHQIEPLTSENAQSIFTLIAQHQDPMGFVCAIDVLDEAGLLTCDDARENLDAVANHQDPHSTARALEELNMEDLLVQVNRDAVVRSQEPLNVAYVLQGLKKLDLISGENAQENRDFVLRHKDLPSLISALEVLSQVNIITEGGIQEIFYALVRHQNPSGVACSLQLLNQVGLLIDENAELNVNVVVKHQNPSSVAYALQLLSQEGLLIGENTRKNFNVVFHSEEPLVVARKIINLALFDDKSEKTVFSGHSFFAQNVSREDTDTDKTKSSNSLI